MRLALKVLCSFIFFMPLQHVHAQRYLGIATSDWNAINSVYLNPANIADCREKFSISIFSFCGYLDNNLGTFPKIADITNAASGGNNIFHNTGRSSFSMLAPAAEVRGPGIMVSINDKNSIALTTDVRGINQFNNFSQSLYQAITNPNFTSAQSYTVKAHNFNWTANLWSEIGLTYAATVRQDKRNRLNIGITIRRLGGIGYISTVGNVDVNYKGGTDSFFASNSNVAFGSNVINDSSAVFNGISTSGLFSKVFGEGAGGGFGADIGFTYRYRIGEAETEDYMESDQTHDIIFSASITDIGSIEYFRSTNAVINVTGSGSVTGQGLSANSGNLSSFEAYTHSQGFNLDTQTNTRKVYLPTALLISGDIQVYGPFCANLLFIGNLANRMNFGNSYYDQLTLTPRYDNHRITIALPITYSLLAHDMKMGIGLRYSGFFIGCDDALALISRYQYGFGAYVGGYIPLFKKKRDPLGYHWHE